MRYILKVVTSVVTATQKKTAVIFIIRVIQFLQLGGALVHGNNEQ